MARGVDGKLHASTGTEAYVDIQSASDNLAEVTSQAHEALNATALEAGARRPKIDPSGAAKLIPGIG